MVKFVFIFLIMKCGVGNGRLIHKKINMSTQRAGGIYEDWDFHNQWMEYDTFEEVSQWYDTACAMTEWRLSWLVGDYREVAPQ